MKCFILLVCLFGLSACGNDNCSGVDTSQAPDTISIVDNGGLITETRTWGSCSKTYTYNK